MGTLRSRLSHQHAVATNRVATAIAAQAAAEKRRERAPAVRAPTGGAPSLVSVAIVRMIATGTRAAQAIWQDVSDGRTGAGPSCVCGAARRARALGPSQEDWRADARILQAMVSAEVQRTLVKSPPELWAELSDPALLARHLGRFGDTHIVRTEPETTVEWAAGGVAGSISIRSSGWGTKVTLSATRQATDEQGATEDEEIDEQTPEQVPEQVVPEQVVAEPECESHGEPQPEPRRGLFARFFRRRKRSAPATTEPSTAPDTVTDELSAEETAAQELAAQELAAQELAAQELAAQQEIADVLTAVLDRLGAAHHRPFSRA